MMKIRVIIIVLIVFSALLIRGQDAAMPVIQFEETKFCFDTIPLNGDGTHVFHFSNMGNAPLIITKAFSSCGCVVPEWTKAPVLPNNKGEVKVKFNTSEAGHFTKVVVVKSNDSNSLATVLRIEGVVKEERKENSL